jgi:tRNA dimethylallyltransferase
MDPLKSKYLLALAGPTASGKTELAVTLAKQFQTEIISADSRQFYHEMKIGTAAPTNEQLSAAKHHFVRHTSIHKPIDVAVFENQALKTISELHIKHDLVIITGGSGLYLDAVCRGLDNIPETGEAVRKQVNQLLDTKGLKGLQDLLRQLDPEYYKVVDLQNPRRLQRAIEVCLQTGKPFSFYRKRQPLPRPYNTIWIGINTDKIQLINRINLRVEAMIASGLIEEARNLFPFSGLNALNTVGYQELFRYFDKKISLEEAIEEIKTNTRRYAKRQLTWFRKNKEIKWFEHTDVNEIVDYVASVMNEGVPKL